MPLTIRLLETDADILAAFPLMAALRDRVRQDTFLAEVRRQQRDGYELIGGFDRAELVALAGIRPGHILSRGRHVFVAGPVTAAARRGAGHARAHPSCVAAQPTAPA